MVGDGRRHYLAAWTDDALLVEIFTGLLKDAGVVTERLPDTIRLQRRGQLRFAFNFGTEPWALPDSAERRFRIGGPMVPPRGLSWPRRTWS
jgi:beta-galactosidase